MNKVDKMFNEPIFVGEKNDKKRTRELKKRAGNNKKYHKRKKAKNGKR